MHAFKIFDQGKLTAKRLIVSDCFPLGNKRVITQGKQSSAGSWKRKEAHACKGEALDCFPFQIKDLLVKIFDFKSIESVKSLRFFCCQRTG